MDEIPPCLGDLQFVNALNLENNSLCGNNPNSISYLSSLKSLPLSKNKLTGGFPASLRNCTKLITLDLGENRFVGKIPKWIGENLTSLCFIILRFNLFDGNLPSQLSLLSELQFLDLFQNTLSGTIPASFGNFSAMSIVQKGDGVVDVDDVFCDSESIQVSWKGAQYEYSKTVSLVININLSDKELHSEIPKEITELYGAILYSSSHLTSLSQLNLSYNNFSGRIPSGNQLNAINDSSIYMGNPFLCGPPISNQCPRDETYNNPQSIVDDEGEAKDVLATQLFYISMGPGFVVGFWIVCGILLFKRSWRIAYYHFFYDMGNCLYVAIASKVMKFKKEGSASKRTTNKS